MISSLSKKRDTLNTGESSKDDNSTELVLLNEKHENSSPINNRNRSINENKCIKCVSNCNTNKRKAVLFLAILMVLIAISIVLVIILIEYPKNNAKNDADKISIKKDVLRFCLITQTPQNEYIYYNGSGMWCHYNGNYSTQCYKQESSKDGIEGILVSNGNETIRLSELNKTTKDPQPKWKNAKWSKVWKKNDVDGQYFYPINNKTWVELQNDAIFAVFQLLDKEKDTFYLRKKGTNDYFKLTSDSLFYGESIFFTPNFLLSGEWVYNNL